MHKSLLIRTAGQKLYKSFKIIFGEYFKIAVMCVKTYFFQTFNFVFIVINVTQNHHDKLQAWLYVLLNYRNVIFGVSLDKAQLQMQMLTKSLLVLFLEEP